MSADATVVAEVLRGAGLSDRPDLYDSSIHSWRCEHPDRYGHCDCFAELVSDLAPLLAKAREEAVEAALGPVEALVESAKRSVAGRLALADEIRRAIRTARGETAQVCGSGVGGGEVRYRAAGHGGEHDPESTEVTR